MKVAKASSLRPRRRAKRLIPALSVACLVAAVPAAHAQEPGVIYEPGSPSAKEYAIPLEEVRREAGGARPGKVEALPFGIGLSRKGGSGADSTPGTAPSGSNRTREGGVRQREGGVRQRRGTRAAAARDSGEPLAGAEDAVAPTLWTLAPFVLVLLPAFLVGLLLARQDRRQPAT